MNNTLTDIFNEVMQREGQTVTALTSGKTFNCFFRKSNDNLNNRDSMILFYPVDAPVKSGSLIEFKGNTYLLMNQETGENEVYFKSAIARTMGNISTHSLSVVNLPFYGININGATAQGDNNLSIIDGNIEVLTEDCEQSRKLAVNDVFNEWGRTWEIKNLFYIDGICHVILEIAADATPTYEYTLVMTDLSVLDVAPGDTASIKATALINNLEVAATIEYKSSNEEVATIDAEGNIAYIADGKVEFSALWVEQGLEKSTELVTVTTVSAGDDVTIYVQALPEICYDFEEVLTFYAMRGGVRDDTIPVSFKAENISVTNNYDTYLKRIVITDNGDHTIQLLVNGQQMLGKTFDLVAYNEEYGVEHRQNIKVTSMF